MMAQEWKEPLPVAAGAALVKHIDLDDTSLTTTAQASLNASIGNIVLGGA